MLILFFSFIETEDKNLIIQTESGTISGLKTSSDVLSFKGIPYAEPPLGDLRWKVPQSVKPWSGILKCKTFGPSPVQNKPAPFSMWTKEFLIPAERSVRTAFI